jgi:MFS family permease
VSAQSLDRSASPNVLARDLRSIVGDGVFYSVMVGLGETYVPAFALALGHGATAAALVATLPMLVGSLAQLGSPFAVRRVGSYRRWVVTCARLQAACFAPLVAAALGAPLGVVGLFAVMSAYWGFSLSTGPAWNAWVGTLVPPELRARFFAGRSRWAHVALLGSLLAASYVLHGAEIGGRLLPLFAALFACAALARFASANYLARQSERPGLAAEHVVLGPARSLRQLRGRSEGRLLLAMLCLVFGTNVAAPFFTPYMLGPVGLDYAEFTWITATVFAARIAVLPLLGRVAPRVGVSRILAWSAFAVVPLPALWLVSHHLLWLFALQILSGVAWGAFEYATLLVFFERIDARTRASVLTLYNAANAGAMALGSLLGALAFRASADPVVAYTVVMALSSALRLFAAPLLRHVPGVPAPREPLAPLTLAVRPGTGGNQEPVLATVPELEGEPRSPVP